MKQFYAACNSRVSGRKMVETFEEFSRLMILWGTPTMIKEFTLWRHLATYDDLRVQVAAFERLLLAIRKDLGGKSLDEGQLMRMFLDAYDQIMAPDSDGGEVQPLTSADGQVTDIRKARDQGKGVA